MTSTRELRKHIVSFFELNGFTVRGDAGDFLTETLAPLSEQEREEWLEKITDHCQRQSLSTAILEKQHLELAILDSCKNEVEDDDDLLKVISAFDVPSFYYDLERKKFLLNRTLRKKELFGNAESKGLMLKDRYTIIHQRTIRNKLFHAYSGDTNNFKLCPVEFLLSTNSKTENVVLLGLLTQLEEGKYYIEDPSGYIQIDLAETVYHDGLFTESCFVLVEGWYQDRILHVQAMGHPPRENSDVSRVYFGNVNIFGGPNNETLRNNERLKRFEHRKDDAMIIFLSEVWLDQPKVFEKLRILFRGYALSPPTAFVLMGNFLKNNKGSSYFVNLKEAFKSLGELIAQFQQIAANSKFIIIPGLTDNPSANILPKPELPEVLLSDLKVHIKNLVSATNPCRIQYCTQEIIIIREDIVTKLCRNSIHFSDLKDIGLQFAKTIISQAHLVPLPLNVCPIYWELDASLYLYPCPDLIVVADQQKAFSANYNNCHVINPGPFSQSEFSFKVYYPATKEIEDCQIPPET
ncbi:DNA polymerase epsilon subunit 2 [Rhodnius prolixus]